MARTDSGEGRGARRSTRIVVLALAVLLLVFLAWLVAIMIRDFWVVSISLMQP